MLFDARKFNSAAYFHTCARNANEFCVTHINHNMNIYIYIFLFCLRCSNATTEFLEPTSRARFHSFGWPGLKRETESTPHNNFAEENGYTKDLFRMTIDIYFRSLQFDEREQKSHANISARGKSKTLIHCIYALVFIIIEFHIKILFII